MGRLYRKDYTQGELDLYVDEKGYNRNDYIGKTGTEYVMEDTSHCKSGYKYIDGMSTASMWARWILYGLKTENASKGSDIQLTIDLGFAADKVMQPLIFAQSEYRTPVKTNWGNYKMKKYANAETAAVAIANVKTGQILGMYSHPSYDSMIFSEGNQQGDWDLLNPSNSRNPIAASGRFLTHRNDDCTAKCDLQDGHGLCGSKSRGSTPI